MLRMTELTGFAAGGDFSPPAITSANSTALYGLIPLSFLVTTSEPTLIAISGADASQVYFLSSTLSTTHTLQWNGSSVRDHSTPTDANADNVYEITLTPTDAAGNVGTPQNLTITVATNWLSNDPYLANVKLLIGAESGLVDESLSAHGTATGSATSSTTKAQFGTHSIACLGNSCRYSDSSDWDLGSGNFTVECWVNLGGNINATTHFIVGQWLTTGDLGWILWVDTSQKLNWNVSTTGSDNLTDIAGSTTLSLNTWHHVCIDYDGSKYRLYVDGVMDGSSTTARTIFNSPDNLSIGANSNSGAFWLDGYIDELRITKGTARYASDSGFLVPPTAFPRSGWQSTFSATMSGSDSTGWAGVNLRQVLSSSLFSTDGSRVRLTLEAGSAFSSATIDAIYIGQQATSGDPYDMKASSPAPAQLLVGGSGSFVVPMGSPVTTDALTFAFDHTKAHVIAVHFSSSPASAIRQAGVTGATRYIKTASSEAATADVTGYSSSTSLVALINNIEVSP